MGFGKIMNLKWLVVGIPILLMGFGSCQGVMLGGSEQLGSGSAASGGEVSTPSDEEEDADKSITDPTQFRPAALPPAIDEPSLGITASLSLTGSTATVLATLTEIDSGLPATDIDVTFVHVRFTEASISSSTQASLNQAIVLQGATSLLGTELAHVCLQTDALGQATSVFEDFNPQTDMVDIAAGCLAADGTSTLPDGEGSDVVYVTATSPSSTAPEAPTTSTEAPEQAPAEAPAEASEETPEEEPADTTPPTVDSIDPSQDSTGASINTSITLTFSEDMDNSTINSTTIPITYAERRATTTTLSGTWSYANRVATFTPERGLSYSRIYTVTITTNVKDVAGNSLLAEEQRRFTTEDFTGNTMTRLP